MKKKNRMKSLYWLIPIVVAVLYLTVGVKAGIVRNATSSQNGQDSISVPFALLDTLGNPVAVDSAQDWGCMITYYPNGTEAVVDSFLLDASTNAQVRYNTARFRGLQTWYYRRQISDLDGTPVNGTYSYQFILRDSSLHMFTIYRGEFQIYQTMTFASVNDSITTAITATNKANFKATGFADSMRDVVGDTFNVVSGGVFLSAAGNKSVTDSIRDVFGDSTTVWKYGRIMPDSVRDIFGDSLTAVKYYVKGLADSTRDIVGDTFNVVSGGVFLSAAGNKSVADSVRDIIGDSLTAFITEVLDSLDSQAWASTSAGSGVDSAVVSRIVRRMWGIQLGTAGSTDSLTKAQRLAALPAATPDSVRDILGDTVATFGSFSALPDSLRDVFGDSTTAWKYYTKGLSDSMRDVVGDTLNVVSGGVFLAAAANKSVADSVRDIFGDSTTAWKASRVTADTVRDIIGDTLNVVSGGVFLAAAANKSVADSVRDIVGDSTTVWKYGRIMPDSVRDIFGDSTTSWKYVTKGFADSTRDIFGDSTTAGGLTAADVWAYGTRTLTSGSVSGTSTSWIALVDAPGTTANRQFVIDSTALGGANETGLTNIAIMVRDADAGKYTQRGIIERVNCVADNCTLQVAEAFLFDFEAGDSVFMKWDEPNYVIATVAEAAAVNADTTFDRDLTGLPQDSTAAGFLKSGGAGGADSTANKAMLVNMGLKRMIDSTDNAMETATADGFLRRGEIPSTRAAAETTSLILADDSLRYPKGGAVDTARNASGVGGGDCDGTGIHSIIYVVRDTTADVRVANATLTVYNLAQTVQHAGPIKNNSNGFFTVSLDSGWYAFMVSANNFNAGVDTVHVTVPTTDSIMGYSYAPSTDPELATVWGSLEYNNDPMRGAWVRAVLTKPDTLTIDDNFLEYDKQVVTDSDGEFVFYVPYLDGDTRNFYYTLTYAYAGQKKTLTFRPTKHGVVNVKDILVDKP